VVLPDTFRGMGSWRNSTETQHQQPGHAPRSKLEEVVPRWCTGEAQMRDNPGGGESDPAEGVRRRCKKNSSVLFCIGKRIREGCDHGREVLTVHSGWDGERSVPPRKPKESGRRESCVKDLVVVLPDPFRGMEAWRKSMKDFVSTKSSEFV